MKSPRITSAITMPTSSTRCWCTAGTLNAAMMMTKTNRLSTDSEYSVMYPAKNSPAADPPAKNQSPIPNATARAT